MTEQDHRRLLVWEARHDNGWTRVVLEQPDGTFVAWAGLGCIRVGYRTDDPEHASVSALR